MIKHTRSLVIILILSLDFLLQCVISAKELPKLHLSHGRIIDKPFQPSRNLDEYFIDFSFINNTSIIQADFGTLYYQINNGTNQNNTLMTISISSNETVLFGNFSEGTKAFNCDPSYCFEDSSSLIQYNSTWLVGNTTQVALGTTISLASGAWELTTSALYMTQSPELIVITAGTVPCYGSIGLGTGSGAQLNFYAQNPVFSIFYNSSSNTGDLIFGYNPSYANTSKPSMTVTSDANWQMQLASISVGNQTVFTVNDTQPINMLFDLMITNIAFPSDIASNIVAGLNQSGLNCYETGCLAPNLTGLPSIIFTLSDNTQLTLEPEVYMVYNMDETDPFYTTQTFETLGSEVFAQNNIVFGTQILAYFYTVFQQTGQSHTITLYSVPANVTVEDEVSSPSLSDDNSSTPDPDPEDSSSLNGPTHIIYILVAAGVALIIVLILAIYLAYKRGWFKRQKSPQDSMAIVELNLSDTRAGLTL